MGGEIYKLRKRNTYIWALTSVRPVSPLLPATIPTEVEFFARCFSQVFTHFYVSVLLPATIPTETDFLARCLSHVFTHFHVSVLLPATIPTEIDIFSLLPFSCFYSVHNMMVNIAKIAKLGKGRLQ